MSHQAQKVGTKLLQGGHYAECYRCCGDPQTDSWITVINPERLPAARVQQAIFTHAAGVEARHARMEVALPLVAALSRTLDSAHMADAMERHGGRIKAQPGGSSLPALRAHTVCVTRCVQWNDEQIRIECDCCDRGVFAAGVVTVFGERDRFLLRAGSAPRDDLGLEEQAEVVQVMERAALAHSGVAWAAQQNR